MTRKFLLAALAGALLFSTACMVGPNYKRPSAPVVPAFKEPPPDNFKEAEAAGWKQAAPNDAYLKGKWWEIYQDPALNALEEQVPVNNQNLKVAEAQFIAAKAAVRVARSALFPTVGVSSSITNSGSGSGGTAVASGGGAPIAVGGGGGGSTRTQYSLPFDVSWEPDLWGSVRRGVTGAAANAQALEANLENTRLLFQSELAQDYFGLHGADGEAELLERTAASYQEYLTLTRNRFTGGVASDLDVAQAESQLYGAQSQLIDLGVQRSQFEHAIAILTGKAPSELTVPRRVLRTPPPPVPVGLPSQLLERRPDIAASERQVAVANENIGIAMAAFYPNLTLSATGGISASSLTTWFRWPSRFWSVGPSLAETLFDAGRRKAVVVEQQAAYDATVATYRQTVLTAFQQVEDNLAALRILADEAAKVQDTVRAADRALVVSTAQYKAGTANYLTVITAQATLLGAQSSAVSLLTRRLTASVLLIQALGGGWSVSELPTQQQVLKTSSAPPPKGSESNR